MYKFRIELIRTLQVVKGIMAISLGLLILLGNMNLTLATHYCGGHMVEAEFVLGESHIGCGMKTKTPECENPTFRKKSCCEDEYLVLNIEDDFKIQSEQLTISPVFLISFVCTYLVILPSKENVATFFKDNPPPCLKQSFQVLFQTFLI